jgi:hypothetical protein
MIDPRLPHILQQARWRARPERFVMVGLDTVERMLATRLLLGVVAPFIQLIVEPDLLTLVLPETDWRALSPAFPRARVQRPFRIITFDLDLPEDLVGFLASVSRALADAGIPILAICGYSKDHVMIHEEHLDQALAAIQSLANVGRE